MMDCEYHERATGAAPMRPSAARDAYTLRSLGSAFALGAAVLLAGCAGGGERRQAQAISTLQHALAGEYGSTATSAGAAPGTAAGDSAVSLTISPITAQLIGDAVYFVRETPADNTQLVLWQGVWTLTPSTGGKAGHKSGEASIVQHSFLFKDPRRWADAGADPDLLAAMLPQDLQALPGCDLTWQRTDSGYQTMDISRSCRPGARAKGLWVELQARLQGSELSLTERSVDNNGALDLGGAPLSLHLSRASTP
jgi:hypothetical protein